MSTTCFPLVAHLLTARVNDLLFTQYHCIKPYLWCGLKCGFLALERLSSWFIHEKRIFKCYFLQIFVQTKCRTWHLRENWGEKTQADIKWMALKRGDYTWQVGFQWMKRSEYTAVIVKCRIAFSVVAKERNFCTKAKSIFIQFSWTAGASKAGAAFKMTDKN